MNRNLLVLVGAVAILAAAAPVLAQDNLPVWEQASKTWQSAMSQYRSNIFNQAGGLFEEFLKKYPKHEYASGTYVLLANCKAQEKDYEGWEKALDTLIKQYPSSGPFFVAYSAKLGRLKTLKKNDDYVATLEAMLRTCKELPLDISGCYVNTPWTIWYAYNRTYRSDLFPWLAEPLRGPGLERDIVEMADSNVLAEKALKAMALTFKNNAKEMPPEWEFAHYMLLKQAGKSDEAEKTLKGYLTEWGADPRGVGLTVLQGEYAQDKGDDATADAAYERLVKDYSAYASVSVYLGPRLDYLRKKGRVEDFAKLGEFYLKTWPHGSNRDRVFDGWITLLRPAAVKGDAEALKKAQELWEQYKGKDSYASLQWLVDVNLELKKTSEALALAEKLLQPAYWSSQTFDLLQKYASRDAAIQKVVEAARTKYEIPAGDPNAGEAGAMLAKLLERIKEDQTRHMEEIGDEMVQKYPKEPATIVAVKKLVDYYFTKLLPEPRDKWIARMTGSYKLHPLTQEVMISQATAANAAKKFDELALVLDNLRERFPTAPYRYWLEQRMSCFDAAKNPAAKAAFAKKIYGADADAGDIDALVELAKCEVPLLGPDSKRIGDYWMEKAKKAAGTTGELYCLWKAMDGYCYLWTPPWQREKERKFLWDEGLSTLKTAVGKKQDPEYSWCLEFRDVDLLSEKHDGKAILVALKAHLTGKSYRDLTYRMSLENTPIGLVEPNSLTKEGILLGEKMLQLCRTSVDQAAISGFLGRLYHSLGADDRAALCYKRIFDDCPWPAKVLGAAQAAVSMLREDPGRANAMMEAYLSKSGQLQDCVMPMWFHMAYLYFNGHRDIFNAFAGRLAQSFPASIARGRTVSMLKEEMDRQKK